MRLIGVSVAGLAREATDQTELFASDRRTRALRQALDRVRDRLGEASVVPAGSLGYRRALGHVPFGSVASRSPGAARSKPR